VSGTRAGDTPATGTISAGGGASAEVGGSGTGARAGRLAQPAAKNSSEQAQTGTPRIRRSRNDCLTIYPA